MITQDGTTWRVCCDEAPDGTPCTAAITVEAADWPALMGALRAAGWRRYRAGLDGRGRVRWATRCPECDARTAGPVIPMGFRLADLADKETP